MSPTFAPLEARHLTACTDLFMTVFNSAPWSEAWQPGTARTYLQDLVDAPRSLGLVAYGAAELIGFALGRLETRDVGTQFYLAEMCVRPTYQGQGVGRELMHALEQSLKAQGVGKVYLLTARGGAAAAFYVACGFYTSQKMVLLGKHL